MALAEAREVRRGSRRVYGHAATVGVIASLTKVLAAVKVMVTARYFGASDELDAFLIALLLPTFFVDTIAGTFTSSLIPGMIRARSGHGTTPANLSQAGLALVLGAMLPVSILLVAAGPWMLPYLGSSFEGHKLQLTIGLFWGMLFWLPLGACSAAWRGVLNAHDRLALAAAVQMGTPVFTIVLLMLGAASRGIWILAIAMMLGSLFEFATLAVAVARLGYPLRPRWFGWTPDIRAIWDQYLPLLIGTMIVAACGLVDQAVAASLGSGSVSNFSYATKFGGVLVAVSGTALATAVLPQFSRLVAEGRWNALRRAFRTHLGVSLAVMTPVTALLIWWSPDVVRAIYEHGRFGADDTEQVSQIQRFHLWQVPVVVVLLVTQRLATAIAATSLILRAGVAAMVTNVAGDLLLPRWFGVSGVALAGGLGQAVFLAALLLLMYAAEPRLFRASRGESPSRSQSL